MRGQRASGFGGFRAKSDAPWRGNRSVVDLELASCHEKCYIAILHESRVP